MGSKAFTGFVVAFWLVMMTALVRVEFFPRESRLVPISTEQVLAKILKNPEPAYLAIVHQGAIIGNLRIEVNPVAIPLAAVSTASPRVPAGYDVTTKLNLNLVVFGAPSRLNLISRSLFDAAYNLRRYDITSDMGGSHASVAGDNDTRDLNISYDFGEGRQQRSLKYEELQNPHALSSLGLPGLQSLPGLGILSLFAGSPASPAGGSPKLPQFTTRAYYDSIQIGDIPQRAYLIDARGDGLGMWVKLWVDEQGGILKLGTSFGVRMLSQPLVNLEGDKLKDRTYERRRNPHP